ncbi:PilN domain-containing protein [Clostridium sp. SM-530-WT-3G]|uniref:PilN domain-containing protein n=1 Tax=Clostridium sp. SM-530-WT-3G TaxID=2725303 RepID=UPI00145C5818|nr:PilN domain-containing protein [Clostridium sp. SM-530-WT-3G]NME83049.1 PilN domain-containing protein [Clostridium sp. SM-530-WT-3G]
MKDLNFFEPYQRNKKKNININTYVYAVAALAGFIIVASFGFNTIKLFILEKQTQKINEKLNVTEIQSQLKEADNINSQINVLTNYNSALTDISKSVSERNNVSDEILNDLNNNAPSSIAFKNIDIDNNVIKIRGTASDWASVAQYVHNLGELPRMQDVTVNSIDQSGAVVGQYSFDMKCVLKEVN